MKINKKIMKVALVFAAAGLLALLDGFFSMYGLVGACPYGTDGCAAYSDFQNINIVGYVLLSISFLLIIYSFIKKTK